MLLVDPRGPDRLLRQSEVAALFGVSTRTVRRWARQGLIRAVRLGGTVRYLPGDMLGPQAAESPAVSEACSTAVQAPPRSSPW
jgi:excisionase family DNA binding protein